MMRRARWIYPALVGVLIILYFAVPLAQETIVTIVGLISASAIASVAFAKRPGRWVAWLLIAVGVLIITAGEFVFDLEATGDHPDLFPSASDVLSLFAYPPLAIGILWLGLPKTPSMDWPALIETAALSLTGILVLWIWMIRPTVDSIDLTGAGKVVAVAMWIGDVVMLVAAVRLVIVWRSNASATMLALGSAALFLADLRYGFDLLHGVWRSGGEVDAGMLVFSALCGGAAIMPSMTSVGTGWTSQRRVGVVGIVSLSIALVVAPTVLLVESTPGPVTAGTAIGLVALLIALLVVVRMVVALDMRQRSYHRDTVVRHGMRQIGLAMSPPQVIASLDATLAHLSRHGPTAVSVNPGGPEPGTGNTRTLAVPVVANSGPGSGWSQRTVVFRAAPAELNEYEEQLVGLAEVAGVALDRIDLAARVRRSQREQDVLAYRATHDALTGLANAELFRDELRGAARRAIPGVATGVLFIDLDDFKAINDSLGHDVGDQVLISTADRIRSCLRRDDIGARLGGDEFAALLRGLADADDAAVVARRITTVLSEPTQVAGVPVVCEASVGLAVASSPDEYDALLRRADTALYAAKAAGKGRFRTYDPAMVNPMRRNSDLRLELERALRPDRPEVAADVGLTVHYQPIVELATGAPRGFEALVRWDHPRRGNIRVPEVIALAENTGLILPLGEWIFGQVLSDGQRITHVSDAYVSVNVSVSQLRLAGFVDRLRAQLDASDVDPARVVLEITESQLVGDDERIWWELAHLRESGVRVAIDDYGAGYASLAYLRHPVIDIVKLDQSFAVDIAEPRNRLLVKSVINLTDSLHLPLVAEGIENETTRDELVVLGCRLGQGYLFAPAMPLDQALTWRLPSASQAR